MGLIELARWRSVLRGLNYYSNKNVLSWENVGIDTYSGVVLGSNDNKYEVYIDINHPRKSKCNCPFADGRRVICKHMIAIYFNAKPEEANKLIKEIEEYEKEQPAYEDEKNKRELERYKELKKYVKSLSKKELQEKLLNMLLLSEYEEDDEYDDYDDYYY